MLALVGQVDDPVFRGVAAAASSKGLSTTTVDGKSPWSVSVLSGPPWRVVLEGPEGPPAAVLNRGLPRSAELSAAADSDLLAAWWAALALFPGRVLNRPDTSAFLPQALPQVEGSVLLSGPDPQLPSGLLANVHDVVDGHFLYRLPGPGQAMSSGVRAVTTLTGPCCWRLVVVGDRRIDVALPAGGLSTAERADGLEAIDTLIGTLTVFALAVLQRSAAGQMRVLALNAMPGTQHYAGVAPHVHAAIVEWLAA